MVEKLFAPTGENSHSVKDTSWSVGGEFTNLEMEWIGEGMLELLGGWRESGRGCSTCLNRMPGIWEGKV